MSIDTITINLDPNDVVITTTMDPIYGPQYTLTIEKAKAAFFANFVLTGLNPADQDRIPVGVKENIIQGTGLKYVFRLPSITRTLLIGTAAGIALKTFSEGSLPKILVEKSPKLLIQGIESVQSNPYLSASVLAGTAVISNLASQEVARFVSDVLEGTKSCITKTAIFGMNTLKAAKNFCVAYPKTSTVLGTAGLAAASWYQFSSVQNAVAPAVKFATGLVKKIH